MHSYEAGAGLLKFINESCLDQVRVNHLIPRGHVELMAFPAGLLRDRCVVPVFFCFFLKYYYIKKQQQKNPMNNS